MNTTYEQAILAMLEPLKHNEKITVLDEVRHMILVQNEAEKKWLAIDPSMHVKEEEINFQTGHQKVYDKIDDDLRQRIATIFSFINEDVVYLGFSEIEKYVLNLRFKTVHVKGYFRYKELKTVGSLRVSSPRLKDGAIIFVKQHGRFYTFNRNDFQ